MGLGPLRRTTGGIRSYESVRVAVGDGVGVCVAVPEGVSETEAEAVAVAERVSVYEGVSASG